ncbi:MAG: response regulator [Nitratireductor sp.]|nr:response regulator [Nitratireductor sp.]
MNNRPNRIVVVDDDPELRALLRRYLSGHGFEVREADSGRSLDRELLRSPADAVVLDLMIPGEDGLAICRRIRAAGDMTPILMLTARGDPIDRIIGLETGADDYLAKPFEPRELVARLVAVLRRTQSNVPSLSNQTVCAGSVHIDLSSMTVRRDGSELKLTSREFALLAALAKSGGRPLSRAQLIERAFGREADVSDRAIDVQIARLRKAIGDNGNNPEMIKTVWGVGYVLAVRHD